VDHFCTLFDSGYLFKAVALYDSLARHCKRFHLTALCFDEEAQRVLRLLSLPHFTILPLADLERADPRLLDAKADRNRFEYCCTATPALPLHLLESKPDLDAITYLDADLYFFSDPDPLFVEMRDASVLITPHRFPSYLRHYELNGIYNVQFMTFRRTDAGLGALRWWHERCLEWCYLRLEDGKYADQKYLDDWPVRFEGVHVLRHKGGGVAPWNVDTFEPREDGGRVTVGGDPLVFFHFHRVRMREDGGYDWRAPGYLGLPCAYDLVYRPYLAALDAAKKRVWSVAPGFRAGLVPTRDLKQRMDVARADLGARAARIAPRLARLRHRHVLRNG
jgi:Nucleotide-diphospho-sugar transferase